MMVGLLFSSTFIFFSQTGLHEVIVNFLRSLSSSTPSGVPVDPGIATRQQQQQQQQSEEPLTQYGDDNDDNDDDKKTVIIDPSASSAQLCENFHKYRLKIKLK